MSIEESKLIGFKNPCIEVFRVNKLKILIVEDNAIAALDIQLQLKLLSYEVPAIVFSGEEALKKISKIKPDLVLMDVQLKGKISGIETAQTIKKTFNLPVIFLTAYSEDKLLNAELKRYDGYLKKPFDNLELMHVVKNALHKNYQIKKIEMES